MLSISGYRGQSTPHTFQCNPITVNITVLSILHCPGHFYLGDYHALQKQTRGYWSHLCSSSSSFRCKISTTTVYSIRPILCVNGESTPCITATFAQARSAPAVTAMVDTMDIPKIPGRRNPPTHIILCEEFFRRREMHSNDEPIVDAFHVDEDDAVCRDWSTPHVSLMEIFSSSIISFVAQKYKMSYSHNCRRDKAPDETSDGLDWMTIQEMFPPSSLAASLIALFSSYCM